MKEKMWLKIYSLSMPFSLAFKSQMGTDHWFLPPVMAGTVISICVGHDVVF